MSVITPSHLGDALRGALGHLDGDLQLPGHPGWDAARASWNLAVDQHPVAVVHAGSAADVAATVLAASRLGLQVAAQATGHAAAVLDDLDNTILVRTDRLGGVEIDPAAMIARVGAGVRWGQVSEAAARHGLAALAGSSPDVGVVGYTLGGGLGWLSRSHGLAANSVTAIELVTADGRARRVTERPRVSRAALGRMTRTPTCGGPFAVEEVLQGSSPPSSSASTRSLRCTPERSGGRSSGPTRWRTPGGSGSARCPPRSPPT